MRALSNGSLYRFYFHLRRNLTMKHAILFISACSEYNFEETELGVVPASRFHCVVYI